MNHKVTTRLFHRNANQRKALLRGLVISLFEHQRIETTIGRAKAIKGMAEKLVTIGRRDDVHSRRVVMSHIDNRMVVAKLFKEIAPRFLDRNGGYLRIIHTGRRIKDQAPLVIIEFVDYDEVKKAAAPVVEEKKA